jgi:hypothetical protein
LSRSFIAEITGIKELSEVVVLAIRKRATWLTVKRLVTTIFNDVYDEHLFVFG